VLEAGSGGAALELLERSADVDLMLIDFAMPGMSGAKVARRAHTTRPALPILFVTGYEDRAALEGVSDAQIIGKPFVDTELQEKVGTASARAPGKVVRLRPC
jgi:CheY-like chemotaxis protein